MMLCVLLIGILTLSLNVGVLKPIQADSLDLTDLELEKSEEWSSVVVNSVFGSDVDGDGDVEIVTGGTDLRIWHWDGATLTQETSTAIVVNSVFCSDVDADGDVEIVTGGVDNLRVFRWDGTTLTQEGSGITIALDSVFCGDVDGDGDVEIVGGGVVGFFVWRWNGAALIMEASTATAATSLFCSDVDGDGDIEIVGSAGSWLRVWRWDGTTLTLEASAGGSSGPYMYSVFAHDVDADGNVEIITGGYFFYGPPLPPYQWQYYCELRVWNSSGTALTLETYKRWGSPLHSSSDDACVRSVYCGNVDDDDDVEIVTGGCLDGEGPLRSWSIKQGSIVLENYANWNAIVYSVFCVDVDGDGRTEIVTGGEAAYYAQLRIWSVLPSPPLLPLVLEASGCGYEIDSTCCDDVDGDGVREIVTGGYYREAGEPRDYYGQLQIWNWNGATLTQEAYEDWNLGLSAASVRSVCADDVDDDGAKEIVTGGDANDGTNCNGQIRVWRWDGTTLTLEAFRDWASAGPTEVRSVCSRDVYGDSEVEIVSGGAASNATDTNGQIRVWRWNGVTLNLEVSKIVYTPSHSYSIGVYSVCTDDVDGDGMVEIVTGGSDYGFAKLRIWHVVNLIGDIDGDGDVDPADFYIFSGAYGTSPPSDPRCDLDMDGDVDPADFYIFSGNYGKSV